MGKVKIDGQINLLVFITGLFLLFSCHKKNTEEKLEPTPFCLSDTLAAMIKIDAAHYEQVQNQLQLSGKVTDKKVYRVFPLVSGFVEEVKVQVGDSVREGQVLAVLKSGEVATYKEQYTEAQSGVQLAKKRLSVANDMFKAGLVAEKDLLAARKEKQNADAALERMREILEIYSTGKGADYIIKAPSSGFIVDKNLTLHEQVRPDDTESIFSISNINEIWVMANVYETDIAKVKTGLEAQVTTISYPGKVFKGKINKIYNVLDPETRVMKVRVSLKNPGYMLKPEMFASVRILFSENKKLLTIPSEAVIMNNSRNYVMVYRKRCDIETREVSVYQTVGKTAYITKGLKNGEKVISRYQLLVYNALND